MEEQTKNCTPLSAVNRSFTKGKEGSKLVSRNPLRSMQNSDKRFAEVTFLTWLHFRKTYDSFKNTESALKKILEYFLKKKKSEDY